MQDARMTFDNQERGKCDCVQSFPGTPSSFPLSSISWTPRQPGVLGSRKSYRGLGGSVFVSGKNPFGVGL